MSNIALQMSGVYKKFMRGERHDSLRDLIPALAKRAVRRVSGPPALRKEEFWALRDVSFAIGKGEAVGIIGHNGAGKSTMLKLLSGIMRPTEGSITVDGRLSALIEVSAGFHQDLTGRENVFLNGVILGMTRAEIHRKFDDIVEFSGLEDFIDTPVKRYSSGMYARLGFSVAVHMEPDILIVDEVLSVGDYVFQARGLQKMRSILTGGATVIFVSHNLRAVADLCRRSLLMQSGQLIGDGPTSEIISKYMDQRKVSKPADTGKDIVVDDVVVSNDTGVRSDFSAGDRVYVDVTVRAIGPVDNVAVVLHLKDDANYEVFNTSSERLGEPALKLAAGETRTYRFELALHLASGTFHLAVLLYRYDLDRSLYEYDRAATLLVKSVIDVRGAANLYPTVRLLSNASP